MSEAKVFDFVVFCLQLTFFQETTYSGMYVYMSTHHMYIEIYNYYCGVVAVAKVVLPRQALQFLVHTCDVLHSAQYVLCSQLHLAAHLQRPEHICSTGGLGCCRTSGCSGCA